MDRSVSLFIRNHVFYFEKMKIDRVSRVERSPAVPPVRVAVVFTSGVPPFGPCYTSAEHSPRGTPLMTGQLCKLTSIN